MNLLTYLIACDVTDRLIHPSMDYKWSDEMKKKIMEQKAEIKRLEEECRKSHTEWDCDVDAVLKDIDDYKRKMNIHTPRL